LQNSIDLPDRVFPVSPPEHPDDPARIRTGNGLVWTRRDVSRGGRALYAPEHVASPRRIAMSTVPELEAQGVTVAVAS